jgi:uncharacterized lipoprotein YmbA
MKTSIKQLVAIAFVAVLAAGCASSPSKFYTLNSTAKSDGSPALDCSVVVAPVSVPAEVNRPQFTVQVAPNQVAVDEFNRWAAPLNENVARVVAEDLAALLGASRVSTQPLANFSPDFRVSIEVQRLESVPGKSALVEAVWVVQKSSDKVSQSGHTLVTEPVTGGDTFDALTAAHSRALAKVSADIAAAIRAEAAPK